MVGTSPILLPVEPPLPGSSHLQMHTFLHSSTSTREGTIPDRIVEAAAQAGAVWQCQWRPTPRPAVRPLEIESWLELFYTFSLLAQAQPSSSCLLSLRVNTSSGPGAVPSVECMEVWCAVWRRQTWNQSSSGAISSIKMNSFVQKPWPASSGPLDGASCAPAFVSPAGLSCYQRALLLSENKDIIQPARGVWICRNVQLGLILHRQDPVLVHFLLQKH